MTLTPETKCTLTVIGMLLSMWLFMFFGIPYLMGFPNFLQ